MQRKRSVLHKKPIRVFKIIEILSGQTKHTVIRGDDLYPLRGSLLCSNCKKKLNASAPRGNGGYYKQYHCGRKTCTKKATGKKPAPTPIRYTPNLNKSWRACAPSIKISPNSLTNTSCRHGTRPMGKQLKMPRK
jgi:hypothetical protein